MTNRFNLSGGAGMSKLGETPLDHPYSRVTDLFRPANPEVVHAWI